MTSNRIAVIGWLVVGPFLLLGSVAVSAADSPSATPNIVIILADDYGYGSATCYGADPQLVRTPYIDSLARAGRRFTDANTTSSVCSPTRYSLLTGRYCWRTSLKHEVLGTTAPLHIETTRMTIASLLKNHGYRSAAIGKWHLGYGTAPRVDYTKPLKPGPLELGFDYHFAVPSNHGDITGVYVENHAVYGLRSSDLHPESTGKNFRGKPFLGLDAPQRVDEDVMPLLTQKAVDWLEAQDETHPFFLYFASVAIHNPVTPSAQTKGTSKAGPYGDWIHELDRTVGRLLETLDKKGVAENTLVLFTSDNGGVNKPTLEGEATDALRAGLKISGPFRGGKHDVWEGGFRVPYIVRWPGRIPPATVCDETISLADTLATLAALVGAPLPPKDVAAEDSYNFLPAWLAQPHKTPIRPDIILHSADGNFAIRRAPWKWIEGNYHPDTRLGALRLRADQFHSQLYDLKTDIGETNDMSAAHTPIVTELRSLLERYREGDYSRELPPPPPPKPTVKPLAPAAGAVVYRNALAHVPGTPWVKVRGQWTARDGVLLGSQAGGERIGAALRSPLRMDNGDIEYDVSLPLGTRHTLRLQGSERDRVFLIQVSARRLALLRQPTTGEARGNKMLAETHLQRGPNEWVRLHVRFAGDQLGAQIQHATVRATVPTLSGNKPAFALMVQGRGVRFRNLVVTRGQ